MSAHTPGPWKICQHSWAECMGCTLEATESGFRALIRDCTSKGCPLWVFRPYQIKVSGESA